MRVRVDILKAPWPGSVKVGDVVELKGDTVPLWAVGKCTQVADEAPAAKPVAAKKGE